MRNFRGNFSIGYFISQCVLINWCFFITFRLLGTIPGPVLYGSLIDAACVLSAEKCLMYDNYKMSIYLTTVTCISKLLAVLCFVLALYCSKWCKVKDDDGGGDMEESPRKQSLHIGSVRKLTR